MTSRFCSNCSFIRWPAMRTQTSDYIELQGKKTDDVLASVETFASPDYGVDVFKLESPLNADDVPGVGNEGWEAAQRAFDEMGRLAGRPWVMLSAGAGQGSVPQYSDSCLSGRRLRIPCGTGHLARCVQEFSGLGGNPQWSGDRLRCLHE